MNEPRRQIQDLWLTQREVQNRAPQEGTLRSVTPTTMSTTTITASNLTSAYVGAFFIPEDGSARGMTRQAKSFVTATGVMTMDGPAWPATTGVTALRIWQPAQPPFVADSGSTTTILDATHASITGEADDYFNNKLVIAKGGANDGGVYQVTDFTSSTGTLDFTADALATAAAPGTLWLGPYNIVRAEGPVTASVETATISRRVTGFKEADQAVPVTTHGTIEFVEPIRGLSTAAGNAVQAVPPFSLGDYLGDFMTQTLDTGSTWSSGGGSAPTGVVANVASGTGFTVGGFVLLGTGEASQITAKATNALTCPQLTAAAPIAGSAAYAFAHYKFMESGFFTRFFDGYRGRLQRQCLGGCVPVVTLKMSRDQLWTFGFKYSAADGIEYAVTAPVTSAAHPLRFVDTAVPTDGKGSRFLIDSVPVFVEEVSIDLGVAPAPRNSLSGMNQMDGYMYNLLPLKTTVSGYLADNDDTASYVDIQDRLHKGNTVSLFAQKGTAPMETQCWAQPAASITKSVCAVQNEALVFNFETECVVPQVARGNSAGATLPPFSYGQG